MTKKLSTLADLAREAGVSESTVSRALSNNTLISQKTRDRIQALAHEHNFTLNTAARNLRLQKSNTIAVVLLIDSDADQSVSDPFILSILGVIADELSQHRYDVLLVSHRTKDAKNIRQYLDTKRADGLIVFGQGDSGEHLSALLNQNLPVVVWGAQTPAASYVTVGTDNVLGGRRVTEHLREQGCQRIAFAGHLSFETAQRYQGYRQALEAAGLRNSHHLDIHFSYEDAYQVTKTLLDNNEFSYDGVVAASDSIALGMIRALSEAGKRVPEDVAITGYDDIAVAAYMQPSLTTIRQDTRAGGTCLVNTLLAQLAGESVQSTLLDTPLIVRQSSQRGGQSHQ
ncbi:LacI family DNA-binding transcriptional regulator [Aestuariibacter halophilus]|uniref:LacI family DNA-binding transcriptional regulator n=1 Tax=Fluctibacter halophilus TaxID=226011 RepID=A0ABS8GBS4_9ALTE|nr:LacI family DNA-binding transcriptional regulator [Aestuariibacter halophilus]MCC2618037.1 LacI family DNA-binding transcriptional regulator [Aestuariibacter halophilus]